MFKLKKARIFSMILAGVLTLTMCTVTGIKTQAADVYSTNSLTNPSFETISGSTPAEWGCGNLGTTASLTMDKINFYDYSKSAKIHLNSTSDQYVIQKWYMPVTAGEVYKAGVYNKSALTAGRGTLNVYFYNSAYNLVKQAQFKTSTGTHEWEYIGGTVTVPQNAVYATYELNINGAAGDIWWDFAEFIKLSQILTNPDFENWTNGLPDTWAAGNLGTGATMVSDSSVYYNGTKSFKINCTASSQQYVLQKWYLPVKPGERYGFSAYHKTSNWSGAVPKMNMYFYNSNKAYISTTTFDGASGTHDWSYMGGSTIVPNNAYYVTLEFTVSGGTGTVWGDNMAFARITSPIRDAGILNARNSNLSSLQIGNGKYLVSGYSSSLDGYAQVAVVDEKTGAVNKVHDLTGKGTAGIWDMCIGFDGKAYIAAFNTSGGSGSLYRMDTANTDTAPEWLGFPIQGQNMLYSLCKGKNSSNQSGVYGGTYPGGKLYFYNSATSSFTDLGQVMTNQQYVRSLICAPNGLIFCGLGVPAALKVYNPSTGTFSNDLIPAQCKDKSFTYKLFEINGKIVASLIGNDNSMVSLIYDPNNLGNAPLVASIPLWTVVKFDSSQPQKVYDCYGSDIREYNINTNTSTTVLSGINIEGGFITNQPGMTDLAKAGYSGSSIVGVTSIGKIWHANISSGNQERILFDFFGAGLGIDSLQYFNGKVYGGVYITGTLNYHDTATNRNVELGMPTGNSGEVYSIVPYNNKLYLGIYTGAKVAVYDPSQSWNPGTTAASNPRDLGSIGYQQYRPYSSTVGSDNKIYFGTAPEYGATGGGIFRLDPSTNTFSQCFRYSEDDDVMAVASGNGVIYGGTKTGRFIIYNISTGTVTQLSPGRGTITSVRVTGNEVYMTTANGYLLVYNTASGWVYNTQITPGEAIRSLIIGKDNNAYIVGLTKFIKFNTSSKTYEVLFDQGAGQLDGVSYYNTITLDDITGNIYFGANERLKVYMP